MSRQAEPLDPRPLSAFHDACIEEIHQGKEERGIPCLLALHTGLRRRIVGHYVDEWRIPDGNEGDEQISLPSGCISCTLEEDGCRHCHKSRYSCQDGHFMVKKNTEGVGRKVPLWETWMDYHQDKVRSTELPKWLDHYFTANDSFEYSIDHYTEVVKRIAHRRHDVISDYHEGEKEVWMGNINKTVPDIKFHDLRATWATQALRAGMDEGQLMDWAGWGDIQMLLRYKGKLNDPSGENRGKYARGRDGEGVSSADKIAKLQEMGLIDDDKKLSTVELKELEELL